MKFWKSGIAGLCLAGMFFGTAMAEPVPVRGIVEGFYGTPWTKADRMDMLRFCGKHGLNAYIYAPKDDPWHRSKWREPYPEEKLSELSSLVEEAKRNHVKFIFAVSPGLDAHYSLIRGYMDRYRMVEKLEALYQVGVRDFAVFFDDIEERDGEGQAEFLTWLHENFVLEHGDISPLITVPTEYYLKDMRDHSGAVKSYTNDFSQNLPEGALPLFTGEGVVCPGISDEVLSDADQMYGRPLGIWWNYPVTDYMEAKLALGPVENLPRQTEVPAVFFNPMKYPELSKISLATAADYAMDPEKYDSHASWEKAIREQYGELAPEMMLFAEHSQHLENDWALVGPPDGAVLRRAMDELWKSWPRGEEAEENWNRVHEQLEKLDQAADKLLKKLPRRKLKECRPQLMQLKRLTAADLKALELMKACRESDWKQTGALRTGLGNDWQVILGAEEDALISQKTCRAFVEEVMEYADQGKRPERIRH